MTAGSAENEIEFYLNESESVTAITLDQFYNKFENIRHNTKVVNIVIASIKDELSKPVKAGYMLTEGRKIQKIPDDAPVIRWNEFLRMGKHCFYNYKVKRTDWKQMRGILSPEISPENRRSCLGIILIRIREWKRSSV